MTKVIHFYAYHNVVIFDNYNAIKQVIAIGEPVITTNQMSFLSTTLFELGYDVFIHDDKYSCYQIKLGDNKSLTDRFITSSHNLFKLWQGGEFVFKN